MDKHKLTKLFLIIFLIFIIFYSSGFICQFINNYIIWINNGKIISNNTVPKIPSINILVCFKYLFIFPTGLYSILITILLFATIILFIKMRNNNEKYDKERNLNYSDKGTYGTSGFMTEKEMKHVLNITDIKNTNGTILGKLNGKIVSIPIATKMNRNIAVYGASGSMKSRAFARNMIFQSVKRGESIIVTDPKSELFEDMSEYLKNSGYIVKVFNLVNPENSDSWNCLAEIEGQELMAQLFSDVIIKNTGSGKGDHFWDNSELNLLKALVLYVEQCYPENSKNIGEVYKLLTLNSEAALNKLFDMLPISHPAKSPYSIFKQAGDNVRGGVIIGLGSRLQVFQNELIRQITSYNEINLELPGKQKAAYFCITSDQDSTFDFLSSLFFSFLFIKLVRLADKFGKNGKLEIPVTFILDEFPNIGAIPDFCKKISTIRSRDLSVSVIFQNLAQMQNRYPLNQWQEIIGNCDTQLFLGCTDEITAKFISDRTGEITVGINSTAKQLNTLRISDYTHEYRETNSIGKRKLLTPDEVLRLPIEKALIILRGQKVLKVDKFDYSLHPESKKLIKSKAAIHIPEWRKNLDMKKNNNTIESNNTTSINCKNKNNLKEDNTIKKFNNTENLKSKSNNQFINKKVGNDLIDNISEKELSSKIKKITKADKDSIMS